MSTTHTPIQPETSSFNPFNMLGGLVSDLVETAKFVGSEASDIPQALADGFNNGLVLDTDNSNAIKAAEAAKANEPINAEITHSDAIIVEPTQPTTEQLMARIAELEAAQAQ